MANKEMGGLRRVVIRSYIYPLSNGIIRVLDIRAELVAAALEKVCPVFFWLKLFVGTTIVTPSTEGPGPQTQCAAEEMGHVLPSPPAAGSSSSFFEDPRICYCQISFAK